MNIVKRPQPRNFRTGKVCLSAQEAASVVPGDTLTILKPDVDEVVVNVTITRWMIDNMESRGDYVLLPYREPKSR